jgi:serine/threonine-protein kinase
VPRLIGNALTLAIRRLEAVGLRARVAYVTSSTRPRIVLSQRPSPGTRLSKGSRVLLNVSSGPNPQPPQSVPDVVGQDQATATSTLSDAGFRVVVIQRPTTDPGQQGIVIDEQPGAGSRIPGGSQVTIFVGSA